MAGKQIIIPHLYTPRSYQLPVLAALDNGVTRAVAVWHRRSGKDKSFFNYTIKRSQDRVGTYHYLFPTYGQAKKVIWEGKDKDGFPFLGHVPPELLLPRGGKNETELKLSFRNGSIVQLVGTDNYDAVIGTNPIGTVWSEYSLQDPSAWDYFRPILRENGGWAIFNFTPRGQNHGKDMFDTAMKLQDAGDPAWFCQKLTVDDTKVLSQADIDAERREGMDEDMIQQEFYCSFEGSRQGSFYGHQMQAAEKDGRVGRVPWQNELPVDTWWDLGMDDATAIWFTQNVGREIHVIDYYENSGEGLPHYAAVLQARGYVYAMHHVPHDISVRELGTGRSRLEVLEGLVGKRVDIVPNIDRMAGIDAARALIPRCWFDREKTDRGRKALASYHKQWDDKRKTFLAQPYHDWSEHGASAFRYLAVGHRLTPNKVRERPMEVRTVQAGGENTAWMAA